MIHICIVAGFYYIRDMKDTTYLKLRKEAILEIVGNPPPKRKPEPEPVSKERLQQLRSTIIKELVYAARKGMNISIEHDPIGQFNFREGYKEYLNKSGKRTITIIIEG